MSDQAESLPRLRVVGCPDCERKDAALAAALIDLENANTDLTVKRREISRLKRELADKHRTDSLYETAATIFDFWRAKCRPKARTFSEDRLKAVLARLKDRDPSDNGQAYPPRYICEAILGAAVEPYRDPKGKVHDDLELICRSGSKLENFHERYERWREQR